MPNEKDTECREEPEWIVQDGGTVYRCECLFPRKCFWNSDRSTTCSFYSLQYIFSLKRFAWKTNAATRLCFGGLSRFNSPLKPPQRLHRLNRPLVAVGPGDSITCGTLRILKYRLPESIWPTIWRRWMAMIRNSRSWSSWLLAGNIGKFSGMSMSLIAVLVRRQVQIKSKKSQSFFLPK